VNFRQAKKIYVRRRSLREGCPNHDDFVGWKSWPWNRQEGRMALSDAERRLLIGTPAEREAEARRQGITETWETKARRDEAERRRKKRKACRS
jgi:hypothetical protein